MQVELAAPGLKENAPGPRDKPRRKEQPMGLKLKNPKKEPPAPPPPPPPPPEEQPDATHEEVLEEMKRELTEMHCSTHESDAFRHHLLRFAELLLDSLRNSSSDE